MHLLFPPISLNLRFPKALGSLRGKKPISSSTALHEVVNEHALSCTCRISALLFHASQKALSKAQAVSQLERKNLSLLRSIDLDAYFSIMEGLLSGPSAQYVLLGLAKKFLKENFFTEEEKQKLRPFITHRKILYRFRLLLFQINEGRSIEGENPQKVQARLIKELKHYLKLLKNPNNPLPKLNDGSSVLTLPIPTEEHLSYCSVTYSHTNKTYTLSIYNRGYEGKLGEASYFHKDLAFHYKGLSYTKGRICISDIPFQTICSPEFLQFLTYPLSGQDTGKFYTSLRKLLTGLRPGRVKWEPEELEYLSLRERCTYGSPCKKKLHLQRLKKLKRVLVEKKLVHKNHPHGTCVFSNLSLLERGMLPKRLYKRLSLFSITALTNLLGINLIKECGKKCEEVPSLEQRLACYTLAYRRIEQLQK